MAAKSKIVAAFAGNRFGKTCALTAWVIIQHAPDELLPDRLKPFKRAKSEVVDGRYFCPTQKTIETVVLPEMRKWMPTQMLLGGSWDKAYSKQHNIIRFKDGGRCEFFTYEQDPKAGVGSSLDYVIFDEPAPWEHFEEGAIRVIDRGGCLRFGMTPVNMKEGGIGWIKREILDKSNPDHADYNPEITVVRGTIWDNPDNSREDIEFILNLFPEDERQARETGDFIHFGGMVYSGGFNGVLREPPTPDEIKNYDVVVGMDPGLKNAAFVWVAFDNENRALVFDEILLQDKTALHYRAAIETINKRWGIKNPLYVVDPAARQRSLVNAESVASELNRQGIFPMWGQNDPETGVQQIRRRILEKGFVVANNLKGLIYEADEYRLKDSPDGEFRVVKENDHRMDALRYAMMTRPWYPNRNDTGPPEEFKLGHAPSWRWFEQNPPITERDYY